jgi:hypothetical protein
MRALHQTEAHRLSMQQIISDPPDVTYFKNIIIFFCSKPPMRNE